MQGTGLCPSFSVYSSATMADIAARVVEELRNEPHPDTLNLFHYSPHPHQIDSSVLPSPKTEHPHEESEFEFAFVTDSSPISSDDIFSNGQIRPSYPVFNREIDPKRTGRTPLRKLMTEERETTTSSSSSEADDLETIPPGTYCVWAPKKLPDASKRKCKKSKSTGSSMRWRLRDLLHRTNSESKANSVILPLSGKKNSSEPKISVSGHFEKSKTVKEGGGGERVSAHFVKSRTVKEGEKRRSYKQDLVGLLSNVNGFTRNLRPF